MFLGGMNFVRPLTEFAPPFTIHMKPPRRRDFPSPPLRSPQHPNKVSKLQWTEQIILWIHLDIRHTQLLLHSLSLHVSNVYLIDPSTLAFIHLFLFFNHLALLFVQKLVYKT
ncbi:hypothetical protein ACMFMG_009792 [Clarireedia jacksonii]